MQRPPANFEVSFFAGYYDASGAGGSDHFAAWDAFQPLLRYDPTKKQVTALDIYHPALADIEVNSVVTEDIGGWEHVGDQLFKRTVKFLEYFPPPAKSATGSPSGSVDKKSGGPAPPPPPDANQSAEDLLKQLQQQAQQQS